MQSAYLVKFPEAVWRQILDNVHRDIAIEMSGGAIVSAHWDLVDRRRCPSRAARFRSTRM
jgi:hypothetical protein